MLFKDNTTKMKKLYLRIQTLIEKDLNEYVKWVLLVGLYVFYRMMDVAYEEEQLVFLVIPMVFIALTVFLSDWIIADLLLSSSKEDGERPRFISHLVASLFYLSILLFIVFYFVEWVPLINLAIFSLLSSALVARYQDVKREGQEKTTIRWSSLLLIVLGLAGFVHAVLYNNYLNVITFVFYIAYIIYYYINLYQFKRENKV
jgi:ABC-type multidrug transport system fused ATPase/permease subunit